MLFVSSEMVWSVDTAHLVSISESRCFSFQVHEAIGVEGNRAMCFNLGIEMLFVSSAVCGIVALQKWNVSISESRCFSFQVRPFGSLTVRALIGSDSARDTFQDARR